MRTIFTVLFGILLTSCNNPPTPVPVPNPGGSFVLTGKKKNVIKVRVIAGTKLTVDEAKRQLGMTLNMLDSF